MRAVEPIAQRLSSGELIRFRCEGDGAGRQNGWAILYLDERPAGAFGNYRLGLSRKWRVDQDLRLSDDERRRLQREWAAAKQRREDERHRSEEEAARDARDIWAASRPATEGHGYIDRKRLTPSMFRIGQGDRLLVPMVDVNGRLWNLQRIAADGTKRFLKGGRVEGLFFLMGTFTRRGETVCMGEGVATMHSVYRSTGYPCLATFSAKNLLAVARAWNDVRPDLSYVICADDDPELLDNPHVRKNVGLEAAKAAAAEIGARLALPGGQK
ncbi:hypothetical protein [Rhizorhabdus histidinilytica]|uniref:hypothetical protein n=1 Tax=Rhizorhabdus histidinilytica TaxID=439228 RepID=UPI001F2B7621|nr:hypothetical protein [Rhizorhabdus histidinilytica]